jgi:hypothetical protein
MRKARPNVKHSEDAGEKKKEKKNISSTLSIRSKGAKGIPKC